MFQTKRFGLVASKQGGQTQCQELGDADNQAVM